MPEITVAVDAAAAAAVDAAADVAAAADRLVSGNGGGPPVQSVKGPLDTKPPCSRPNCVLGMFT